MFYIHVKVQIKCQNGNAETKDCGDAITMLDNCFAESGLPGVGKYHSILTNIFYQLIFNYRPFCRV